MRLAQGELIAGKYRIESLLGRGGMGEVYVALNERLGKRVALKVMSREVLDAEEAHRFAREAKAASRIAHPGVVQVFDADVDTGRPWIAMELLEGESLAQRISRGPCSVPEAGAIMLEALDVVAAVHDAGVIHRDLKPDNLFLERLPGGRHRVKVLDFGIAKVALPGVDSITQTGAMMGTPLYLAPEQAAGAKHVDQRADIYSLGVILYAMLSGRLPYEVESFGELVAKMMTKGPQGVGSVAPHVAPAMVQLVDRCIAVEPTHRPQSARAFAEELRVAIRSAAVHDAMASPARAAPAVLLATMPSQPVGEPRARRRFSLGMVALVGAIAGTLVAGAVVVVLQSGESGEGPVAASAVPADPVAPITSGPVPSGMAGAPNEPSVAEADKPELDPSPGEERTAGRRPASGETASNRQVASNPEAGSSPETEHSPAPTEPAPSPARESPATRPTPTTRSSEGLLPPTGANVSRLANQAYRRSLRCFEMRSDQSRGGFAAVQFDVAPDGTVSRIRPNTVSFDESGRVHRCLGEIVQGWRFAPSDRVLPRSHAFEFNLRDIRATSVPEGELPERPPIPEIRAAAQSVQQRVRECTTGSGASTVNLTISGSTGRVTELTFGLDEHDPDNQRCIEPLVRGVRFPRARGDYPFRHRYGRGR